MLAPHCLSCRLLDQWAGVDRCSRGRCPPITIIIPLDVCNAFPSELCPVPYGVRRQAGGCTLDRWLMPEGCILPPPWPVLAPLLGQWERQSQPLAVNEEAKAAFRQVHGGVARCRARGPRL